MIGDALTWWSRQMLDLAPARFTRPDPSEAGALLVEPFAARHGNAPGLGTSSPAGARLTARENGGETVIADLPLTPDELATPPAIEAGDRAMFLQAVENARGQARAMPVLLRLPASAALRRDVGLPLAAEAGLERVLSYEMDRLTPFSADEAFYAYSVTGRDREAQRLTVRLSLVPRAPLRPLLGLLSECGAAPQAIEIAPVAGIGGVLRIPLEHDAPLAARRQRLLLRAAWIGCAVLALLAILLPFLLQSIESRRVEQRIAALQPEVRVVQALQRRIAGGSAGAMLVQAERARLGDALGVMSSLTGVLPDDSFLTDLSLRRGQLTVSGQSPSAARLIPAISADPAFSAPAFSAPVTRIEGQDADLFSIKAGVAH